MTLRFLFIETFLWACHTSFQLVGYSSLYCCRNIEFDNFVLCSYVIVASKMLLKVFAIEFITFAVEFGAFAVEFVSFAIEFIALVIEFDMFATELSTLALEFICDEIGSCRKHENKMYLAASP